MKKNQSILQKMSDALMSGRSRIHQVQKNVCFAGLFLTGISVLFSSHAEAQTRLPGPNIGDKGSVTFFYQNQRVTYTTVRAADGNVWTQQNLGATKVADSLADVQAYGDYFQWGRWDDGHQLRASITRKPAYTLTANNPSGLNFCADSFITSPNTSGGAGSQPPYWWTNGDENNTWTNNPPSATNGFSPCAALGIGWRLGDSTEWADILRLENINDLATGFSSHLKIGADGYKSGRAGTLSNEGRGFIRGYWTSSPTPQYSGTPESGAYYANPSIYGSSISSSYAQNGFSIRCLLPADAVIGLDISGPDTVCNSGGSVSFSTPALGIASYYLWQLPDGMTGESDSNSIIIAPPGATESSSATITVYAFNHCDDTVAVRSKDVIYSFIDAIITVDEFVLSTTEDYVTYQWLKEGAIIPGATAKAYTVTENAQYRVVVTNRVGCVDTSEAYVVTNVRVSIENMQFMADQISIYPNPAADYIRIKSPVVLDLIVTAIDGRQLMSSVSSEILSLKGLNQGVYLLHLRDKQGRLIKVEKLIKP